MANSRSGKGESTEKCSYPAIVPNEERAAGMTERSKAERKKKAQRCCAPAKSKAYNFVWPSLGWPLRWPAAGGGTPARFRWAP